MDRLFIGTAVATLLPLLLLLVLVPTEAQHYGTEFYNGTDYVTYDQWQWQNTVPQISEQDEEDAIDDDDYVNGYEIDDDDDDNNVTVSEWTRRQSYFKYVPTIAFGNISTNPHINAIENKLEAPTRIVNGKKISCERAPYQCSLHFRGYFICGCVVIAKRWILTAHHCIVGGAGSYTVRAGTRQQRRYGELRRVRLIVAHANYNPRTMQSDIALMKLRSGFVYDNCLQPVDLPSPKVTNFPNKMLVSGWGITSANAVNVQRYLRAVMVYLVPRSVCIRKYAKQNIKIYKSMICAARKNRDSCSGDSGGPLVHNNILFGLVSFGIGCANSQYPGVYCNVKRYVPWIKKVVKKY